MKYLVALTGLFLLVFIYAIYLSQVQLQITPDALKRDNPPGFYDYRGIGNVHTNISIGSSSPVEVIADAKKVGLDFLILTDINKFSATENLSGYHGNLLVFDEGEYSYLDSRLQYLIPEKNAALDTSQDAHVYFTDLLSQKTSDPNSPILILALPFNNGLTWSGEFPPGLHGLEILNPKGISDRAWKKSKLNVILSVFQYPLNAQYAFLRLFQEPTEEVALWDKLNQDRVTIGFAGADASARAIPYADLLLKFPSYQRSLEVVSNHVLLESELTGNFIKDKQKIFSALRDGRFYMSMDLLGNPTGFFAEVLDRDKSFLMGSKIKYSKNLKLHIHLPVKPKYLYEVVVYKNGEREAALEESDFTYQIKGPGVYRAVVRSLVEFPIPDGKKWVSWIYTNPFFIR